MNGIGILISEKPVNVNAGTTLFELKARYKPEADIVVYNGAPVADDRPLVEGDAVVFIRRGEIPDPETLEALMAARHTPGVHQIIRRAQVGIAGLGGLGSSIAIALARIGIGSLVLADFDVVEPSNLNRQQYFVDQIGAFKTDALKDTLFRVNPYAKIETHAVHLSPTNIPAIFKEVQILVEAFDREDQKAMLVETAMRRLPQIPVVAASGLAGHFPANDIKTAKVGPRLYLCGDAVSEAAPGCGLMAPRVGVAAHHQANAVLRLLLGESAV